MTSANQIQGTRGFVYHLRSPPNPTRLRQAFDKTTKPGFKNQGSKTRVQLEFQAGLASAAEKKAKLEAEIHSLAEQKATLEVEINAHTIF